MKTTLDLNDELLTDAKRHAAARGSTLRAFVEEALRAHLPHRPTPPDLYRLELPVIEGSRPPAVEVADRSALYDLLAEGS